MGNIIGDFLGWASGGTDDVDRSFRLRKEANVQYIPTVYGQQMVEPIEVFKGTWGTDDKYLTLCLVLCEGEIEAIDEIFVDDKPLTDFSRVIQATHPSVPSYVGDDHIVIEKFLGTDTQTTPTIIDDNFSEWTTSHRLRGRAYIAVHFLWKEDYYTGQPRVTAKIRGKKVYDPRTTNTEYSTNPALCLWDYLTSTKYGKGLDTSQLDQTAFENAADDLDAATSVYSQGNFGTPDDVVSGDAVDWLAWDSLPANAFIDLDGTVQNAASSPSRSSFVWGGFNHRRWAQTPSGKWYLGVDPTEGFTTSDTIYFDSTSRKLWTCNATIDNSQKVFDNVKTLLGGMRGFMPYVQGQYSLLIDQDKASVFDVDESHIIGGISIRAPRKKDKYNRVTATYTNPNNNWKDDIAIFPEPGSVTEGDLLDEDNGTELYHEIKLPTVASYYLAREIARLTLYKSRNALRCSFDTTSELLQTTAGDIIRVTHTTPGWTNKEFLIESIELKRNGEVSLQCVEHSDAIWAYDSVPLDLFKDDTDLPDPFTVTAPTGLTATTQFNVNTDGSWRVGILVSFDVNESPYVDRHEVQWKDENDTYYQGTQFDGNEFLIPDLDWLATYDIRVRAWNSMNKVSSWVTTSETIVIDTTAPGIPTALSAQYTGAGQVLLSWTNPSDSDLKEIQIYQNTINSLPGSHSYSTTGDEYLVSDLTRDQLYYFWVRAVDNIGNASSATASVNSYAGAIDYANRMVPRFAGGWSADDNRVPVESNTTVDWVSIAECTGAAGVPPAAIYGTHALKIAHNRTTPSNPDAWVLFGTSDDDHSVILDPGCEWLFKFQVWSRLDNTDIQVRLKTAEGGGGGTYYAPVGGTDYTIATEEVWTEIAGEFDLTSDTQNYGRFRIDIDSAADGFASYEDWQALYIDAITIEKKTSSNTEVGSWIPPTGRGGQVKPNEIVPGTLPPGMGIDDGGGEGRPLAYGLEWGYASDGVGVTFNSAWSEPPNVVFLPGGITNSATLGANQYIVAEAVNISTTGFTPKIRLRDPVGTPTSNSDGPGTAGTGNEPDFVIHKSQSAEAWDDRYTFQFDVTVTNGDGFFEPGIGPQFEPGRVTITLWVAKSSGVWTQVGSTYVNGSTSTATTPRTNITHTVSVDGLGQHSEQEFGISLGNTLYGGTINNFDSVDYETASAPTDVSATPSGVSDVPWLVYGG